MNAKNGFRVRRWPRGVVHISAAALVVAACGQTLSSGDDSPLAGGGSSPVSSGGDGGVGTPAGGAAGGQSAAGSQSIAGVTFAGEAAWGGQGGAGGGGPRCATTLRARCLATNDGAGGAAGLLYNAVAELVGAHSVNAVNNHNQLVGSRECGSATHAFMHDDSGVHDLLGDVDDVSSSATAINDSGMVVGDVGFEWLPSGGLKAVYPFVWQNGVTTVLRDVPGAHARAVNGHGQVLIAGENAIAGAFLWESGTWTHLGANLWASGLNNLGQVVGTLSKDVGGNVGFIWADGVMTELPLLRAAIAINDSGQIAGTTRSDGTPVLVDGASIVELGPWPIGVPLAITADGTVLGSDYVYAGGVLTRLSGRVGSHSFEEVEARGINADRVVVGTASVLTFRSGAGSCRMESCEIWTRYAMVWKEGCFAACCGEATGGAGGAGGEAAGGASQGL